jgi:hypothetical protein
MRRDRWIELMEDEQLELTFDELEAGWHWCWEWDGLLVGPGMPEYGGAEGSSVCYCGRMVRDSSRN